MSYIIFCISIIGLFCICFTMNNYWYLYEERTNKGELKIIITKENVDYEEKKEIINKIMYGEYEELLDIVDNIRIN